MSPAAGLPAGRDAVWLPFQRTPGTDSVLVDAITMSPADAGAHGAALQAIATAIVWVAPRGKAFPHGEVRVDGVEASRNVRAAVTAAMGCHAPVIPEPTPAALVGAWEAFLAEYRGLAARFTAEAAGRRADALSGAAAARLAYDTEMDRWIHERGSRALRAAHMRGARVHRDYRDERRDQEMPGFFVDADGTLPVSAPQALSPSAEATRDAVMDWLAVTMVPDVVESLTIDLVYVRREDLPEPWPVDGGLVGIRVGGWLGRHALLAFCAEPDEDRPPYTIGPEYPDGVPLATRSLIRPTGFGSCYGVRHPAVREALRVAAVVARDQFVDGDPIGTLYDWVPEDLAGDIVAATVDAMHDTFTIVGWKLGQPQRLRIACLAEVIAAALIVEQAIMQLAIAHDADVLTGEGHVLALAELERSHKTLFSSAVLEYLEDPQARRLEDIAGAVVEPRWLSLWAPFDRHAGDPAPTVTDGTEGSWMDDTEPGTSAAQAVAGTRLGGETTRDEAASARVRAARWRADTDPGAPPYCLLGEEPDGGRLRIMPPLAMSGAQGLRQGWAVEGAADITALRQGGPMQKLSLRTLPEILAALPAQAHPLVVDAIIAMVNHTMHWQSLIVSTTLAAGPIESLDHAADALEGAAQLRAELEQARLDGLVRDRRLTRFGLRDEHFGDYDSALYEATIRFRREEASTMGDVLARFHERLYDLSSLPVALHLDVDPVDAGNVILTCAITIHTLSEARAIAFTVIRQIGWALGFGIVDLGDSEDGPAGFTIGPIDRS